MKKVLALLLVAAMALCMTACGGSKTTKTAEDTAAADDYEADAVGSDSEEEAVAPDTQEDVSDVTGAEVSAPAEDGSQTSEEGAESTTEAAEPKTPETVEEIVEFYKAAATKTNKGKIKATDQMTLVNLDGGGGLVGGLINLFEPIAKNALAKNSGPVDHVTGGFENLTADDVASATAKNDGKYTTVRINLKEQTDGMNGKSKEGHVGHGVSILDGVQKAIDQLDGVSVDASNGTIKLHYNKAYIDVKIDNATGKIVSGKWHYTVDVTIDNVTAKISFISATLHGASGQVDYMVTL